MGDTRDMVELETREHRQVANPDDLNLKSAFAHVGADTLRTISELVAAFIIEVLGADAVATDAATSILINITILASGLYILLSLLQRCRVNLDPEAQESEPFVSSEEMVSVTI